MKSKEIFKCFVVNGKKKEKFRQRAVALRRVSIVLLVFGLIKCKLEFEIY